MVTTEYDSISGLFYNFWGFTAARDNGRVGDNQTLNSLSFDGHFSRQTWVSRSY